MNKLLLVLVASLASVGLAIAAPVPCTAPPPPGVDVMGLTYTCGGLTFTDFNVVGAANVQNPLVTLTGATYDADTGEVDLSFNPNLMSEGIQDIYLYFMVQGYTNGADLAVGGTNASVSEKICSEPFVSNVCESGVLASLWGVSDQSRQWAWYEGTTGIYIFKDISINNGELSSFTESFHAVPEPLTFVLLGSGLLGLGLLRRRSA